MGELSGFVSAITTTLGLPDPIDHSSEKSSHSSDKDSDSKSHQTEQEKWADYDHDD